MIVPRVLRSWLVALLCAVGVAVIDARAALAGEPHTSLGALVLASFGLTAPLTLVVATGAALVAALLHPDAPPSLPRLVAWLDRDDEGAAARARVAFAAPLATLAWLTVTARAALAGLASEQGAAASGAAIAGACVVLACTFGLGVAAFGRAGPALRAATRPSRLLALSLAVTSVAFGALIVTGSTSGGGGAGAVFGVLRREELDLRGVGLTLALALAAYLGAWLAARVPAALGLLGAAAALAVTAHAARGGLDDRRRVVAIERGAPLAKLLLGPLRRVGDADHDGASRYFGGGDCNDRDPAVRPGADDVPANGVDEDCSGADAEVVVLDAPPPVAPASASEWIRAHVPHKPNVVLITIDTLRWDLGYMGNPRAVSAQLDALARRSIVFEHAYSLASYTSKSIGPLLIGKYGSETHRGWSHFNTFGSDETFVQERLRKAGVRTLSVQGHWYFKENTGLGRGFDVLDLSGAPKVLQQEGDRSVISDRITDAAIAQLGKSENTSNPFYLWVHYLDPHAEYVKNAAFDFGGKERDLYDSEVAFTDAQVGRLLDFIAKSSFGERTVVIVTADHGEAFGEHKMIRHGFEVWDELVRVPLIISIPGLPARRVSERRGAIDLVPTLLDLFQVPPPSGQGNDFVSGESLLADLTLPPGHEVKPKIVFVDMTAGPNNAERQAFIEHDLKLIVSSGRALGLYDLAQDPGEKRDLLDDDAARAKTQLERYRAFRRRLREVVVRPQ